MKIITPKHVFPITHTKPTIFLAGPTLRNNPKDFTPWREETIKLFSNKNFEGTLFIPEPFQGYYEKQIRWEEEYLDKSNYIMFWIPRNMQTLPGLTTNVEFGEWMKSNKVILGFPKEAEHMRYLEYKAKEYHIPVYNSLEDTVDYIIKKGLCASVPK